MDWISDCLVGGKTVIVCQPPQINPVGSTFLLVKVEKITIALKFVKPPGLDLRISVFKSLVIHTIARSKASKK